MKLLKDIRDSLIGGARSPIPDNNDDNNNGGNNDNNDDNNNNNNNNNNDDGNDDGPYYNDMPDLETEEEALERISTNALDQFKNNIEIEMNN